MPLGAHTTGTTSRRAKLQEIDRRERGESQRICRSGPALASRHALSCPIDQTALSPLAPFSPAARGRRVGDEGGHKQRHLAQLAEHPIAVNLGESVAQQAHIEALWAEQVNRRSR
jgi:hypothetical protein